MAPRFAGARALLFAALLLGAIPSAQTKPRARDLGVPFDGVPGALNAITDVPGVQVGHTTLIEGSGPLVVGSGPVRTGVTVVLPHAESMTESTPHARLFRAFVESTAEPAVKADARAAVA